MSTKIDRTKPGGEKGASAGQSAKPITFRLDSEFNEVLAERATQLGVSPHELARSYVREALTSQVAMEELFKAIVAMRDEQLHLRQAFGRSVETLMVSAGRVSVSEAQNWTKQTFGLK